MSKEIFFDINYQKHNIARLSHLDSLELDLRKKSVIEFGCGVGDHTYFYLTRGCNVLATDGRKELVEFVSNRYGVQTLVLNVENDINRINELPFFDIVHCYGLLYHIANPEEFIRSLKGKTDLFLLETCVSSDFHNDKENHVSEDSDNATQAISGIGCRPTRKWIAKILKETFDYVYFPLSQPSHHEFPTDWTIDFNDSEKLIRSVFIASTKNLDMNKNLTSILPQKYFRNV